MDLEERLIKLSEFGQPTVRKMGNGWYAKIEMNTSIEGAEFQIASEFDHATPSEAMQVMWDRVMAAAKRQES